MDERDGPSNSHRIENRLPCLENRKQWGCIAKNRYRTKGAADRAACRVNRRGASVLRSYHCPDCKGFHLTSKPKGVKYKKGRRDG